MSLVTPTEVAKALNIEQLGSVGRFMAKSLMKLSKIDQVNQLFESHKHLEAIQFVDAVLEDLGVKFEIPDKDLKRIPSKGAFITISNHPLGGVDGLLLMKILWSQREDFKIIANFLLQRLTPLEPKVLPVNPFEDRKEVKSSLVGIKNALLHLSNESPFGIFPSGEVSSTKDGKDIVDQDWSNEAIRLIKKAKVPVLPIYFHAKNSPQFYKLSQLNKTLRLALLPREVYTQKNRLVKIRVGNIISVKEQSEIEDIKEFKSFLRRKTYMLSSAYEKKRLIDAIPKQIKLPRSPKEIIGGVSISNKFSNFSKSMMIEFMKSNYYDPYLAQFIHPKKEFKVKLKDADKDFVFDHTQADLNKFDKIIDEIEPDNLRLPVLIKKYIKQNARVVAFNIDPLFNNAIDGLMYIRVKDLPESTVKPVLEELQKELEDKVNAMNENKQSST